MVNSSTSTGNFRIQTDATYTILFTILGTNVLQIDSSVIEEYVSDWTFTDNQWYKFNISFECTNGNYRDLDQYSFSLTIDDVIIGIYEFKYDRDYINRFLVLNNRNYHLDNFWYSWNGLPYGELDSYRINTTFESINLRKSDPRMNYQMNINAKTNITHQNFNISLYNYDDLCYDYLDSINLTDSEYLNYSYDLTNIESYLNENNKINVSFSSINLTNSHQFIVDFFQINETAIYNAQGNQSLRVRVDSWSDSDILINQFYINLDFNSTHGIITWDALYRNSLEVPHWTRTPTNPVFRFSDYMPEGTVLTELQVNFHFFLTYHSGQKWIYVRTQVCMNDHYSMLYQYDKIIDAGNNQFYDTQRYLKVEYFDYFNPNEAVDYKNETGHYTFNNLRGFRTLELNSTLWKFNFLHCGFFMSDLEIYIPPEIPEPDPQPDPPDEPDPPDADLDYWGYMSFRIVQNGYNTIYLQEDVAFYNETVDVELDYQFDLVEAESYTAKFYYDDEYFDKDDFPSKFELDIGLGDVEIDIKWLRDIILLIGNSFMVFIQFLLFLLVVAFNYIILFLVIAFVVPFIWNYPVYWVVALAITIGFYVYTLFVYLVGWLWFFLVWIFTEILVPLFNWLVNDGLPLIVDILIIVMAFIIALIFYAMLLGQQDFDDIYNTVHTNLTMFVDEVIEIFVLMLENSEFFLLFLAMYIVNIGLIALKYFNAKGHGHVRRSERCYSALQVFTYPFVLFYNIMIKLKALIHPTSS
jgi:hypothetical protein